MTNKKLGKGSHFFYISVLVLVPHFVKLIDVRDEELDTHLHLHLLQREVQTGDLRVHDRPEYKRYTGKNRRIATLQAGDLRVYDRPE
jgi:hypothetical protein